MTGAVLEGEPRVRLDRGAVLVTGAASGIGRAVTSRLVNLKFHVLAGVRSEEDAERLSAQLGAAATPLQLDITDSDQISEAADRASSEFGGLAGLVNNAGTAMPGPFEVIPLEQLRAQLEVNFVGHVAVTQAMLPLLRLAQGRIINIGSVGGRFAAPFNGPYHASKYALEAFTDSLRVELRPWEIRVAIIEPGGFATGIWEKGAARASHLAETIDPARRHLYERVFSRAEQIVAGMSDGAPSPEPVARAVGRALTTPRPRPRYVVGNEAKAILWSKRILPTAALDALIAKRLGI